MKIVYCIPSVYNSGGMERVLSTKANYLADVLGWEVSVVTSCEKGREPFYPFSKKIKFYDLGIDYESLCSLPIYKRIYGRLKAKREHKRKLTELLMELRPDVTVSMFTHEMSFLPFINDGSKKLLELHFSKNFRKLDAKSNNQPLWAKTINAFLDYSDRQYINDYDRFVVLTQKDADDWGSKIRNIVVIPNPVSFEPHEQTKSEAKRALAIGRICAQKGFDTLIDIWAALPPDKKRLWHLDIVGSGPDESILRNKIKYHGLEDNVSIIPPTQSVESQLKSHSVFCFTSRYEGFGLALLEAMSYGLSVVSYDCPCGPSDIITDGENGLLVSEQDAVKPFTEKLALLMDNEQLRGALGRNAAETVASIYSVNIIMREWRQLFENLVSKKQ